jgi:hypothetical protein
MTATESPRNAYVDREPPAGYKWPGADTIADALGQLYWLATQPDWDGATPLFVVMCSDSNGQKILAERCYRKYGVEIVDALRQAASTHRE